MTDQQPKAFGDDYTVEEIAKIIDPTIVEPMRSKLLQAWTDASISQEDADKFMVENEAQAYAKARLILRFLKGEKGEPDAT